MEIIDGDRTTVTGDGTVGLAGEIGLDLAGVGQGN
jgi:hypothetical protein